MPSSKEQAFAEIGELAAGLDALEVAKDEKPKVYKRVLKAFAPLVAVAVVLALSLIHI
jgi:hypothetical protein